MRNGHVALGGQALVPILTKWIGRGREMRKKSKRKREGKCGIFRERSSTFSLSFPTIGPVSGSGARGRVDPHSESFASRPVLGSFDKLQKGRVFLLLALLFV